MDSKHGFTVNTGSIFYIERSKNKALNEALNKESLAISKDLPTDKLNENSQPRRMTMFNPHALRP